MRVSDAQQFYFMDAASSSSSSSSLKIATIVVADRGTGLQDEGKTRTVLCQRRRLHDGKNVGDASHCRNVTMVADCGTQKNGLLQLIRNKVFETVKRPCRGSLTLDPVDTPLFGFRRFGGQCVRLEPFKFWWSFERALGLGASVCADT